MAHSADPVRSGVVEGRAGLIATRIVTAFQCEAALL